MSALFRLSQLRGCQRALTLLTTNGSIVPRRSLATESKEEEYKSEAQKSYEALVKKWEQYPTKKEPWVSYGFDDEDKDIDRLAMHSAMFMAVTVCLVFGSFVLFYYPDVKYKDWAQREAYLQLRYREENGLPLIDPNVIDPAKIILPTEEELGDAQVII